MRFKLKLTLFSMFTFATFTAGADSSSGNESLSQYLEYLGGYLGYDLSQNPAAPNQQVSAELLSIATTQLAENYVFNTFFGSMPVAFVTGMMIVPQSFPGAQIINKMANATYTYQKFDSPTSADEGKVSVNKLIDQQTYQADPVNQAVLNILGTPDYSFCMSYDKTSWTADCALLYQNKVMQNVIGTVPKTADFFSYDYNQSFITQLNSNSLMGPLQYSTDSAGQGTGSPTPNNTNPGLASQNQAQQAYNFIRYASGAVTPGSLPDMQTYDKLYVKATTQAENTTTPSLQQIQAQSILSNYLANIRVYAAQSSIGIGNLYFLLSKRLPQNLGGDNSILTSQALSEFNLASWRLFKADLKPNKQWINQINEASAATVQKEMLTLLAEMNYQLYLNRQIQERILLTNSVMLIQNTRASLPSANFVENAQ